MDLKRFPRDPYEYVQMVSDQGTKGYSQKVLLENWISTCNTLNPDRNLIHYKN